MDFDIEGIYQASEIIEAEEIQEAASDSGSEEQVSYDIESGSYELVEVGDLPLSDYAFMGFGLCGIGLMTQIGVLMCLHLLRRS